MQGSRIFRDGGWVRSCGLHLGGVALLLCLLQQDACGEPVGDDSLQREAPRVCDEATREAWLRALQEASPQAERDTARFGPRLRAVLQRGVEAIRSRGSEVRHLSWDDVRGRIGRAPVVLVGDRHSNESRILSFSSIVLHCARPERVRRGLCGVTLERAWWASQDACDRVWAKIAQSPREGVVEFLARNRSPIAWPEGGYHRALPQLCEAGVKLMALGAQNRSDASAAQGIASFLKMRGDGAQVFGFFGTSHVLGEGSIAARLREAGIQVVVVICGNALWDSALVERFGIGVCLEWYEILPGVVRAPPAREVLTRAYRDDHVFDVEGEVERTLETARRRGVLERLESLGIALAATESETIVAAQLRKKRAYRESVGLQDGAKLRARANKVYEDTLRRELPTHLAEVILRDEKLGTPNGRRASDEGKSQR